MTFLHPGWLSLLLILPLILLGAILSFLNQGKAWEKMVAPRLRKQLVKTTSPIRRWIALALGLIGCALIITALARPYKGESVTTEQINSRNILLAIDTSRSMLVQDGAPDRMSTAKAMAIEVLHAFPNDRVGILAFSGTSVLMAPLTIDHGSVQDTIGQLDTEVIPSGGSDLSSVVTTAIETFKKTGQKANALIIISDGEDHSTATSLAAEKIRESKTVVCAIGIGTDKGGIIPDRNYRDGKFRDNRGQTVYSKMNPEALESLVRAGQGSYTPASSGSTAAVSSTLNSLKRNEQDGRETTVPNEFFQWFLIPAILLLTLSTIIQSEFMVGKIFRPKTAPPQNLTNKHLVTLLLLTLLLTPSAKSATLLQQAEESYSSGEYEKALKLFAKALPNSEGEDRHSIQFSIGSTAYKLKQWKESNNHLSAALLTDNIELQEQVHYNLGNSLFMTAWSQATPSKKPDTPLTEKAQANDQADNLALAITSLEDSISHYQAALDITPNNSNAAENLEQAKKLLEQLKQKQQQNEQKNQEQQQDQGKPKDQQGDSEQPQSDPNADPEKGNQGEQPDENKQPGDDQGEGQAPDQNREQDNQQEIKNQERGENESDEAYAARILKENSDSETRPVQRRLLRLRRPAKDW